MLHGKKESSAKVCVGLRESGMKNNRILYVFFAIMMMVVGAGDSLRGVVTPVFSSHFSLDAAGLSTIITMGYLGNLVFLFAGGKLLDKLDRKKALTGFFAGWITSAAIFALTDNYICLLAATFFSLGLSTLIGTAISLTAPLLFLNASGMLANILFFVQCIGTVSSQSVGGNLIRSFGGWRIANLLLFVLGVVTLVAMQFCKFPEIPRAVTSAAPREKPWRRPAFVLLILTFGTYFIAEHGVMNWLVSYTTSEFGLTQGSAANYAAIFYGGIMIGRLVFSPLIDRLGVFRSLRMFSLLAAGVYSVGVLMRADGLWVLAGSGLLFSVIYPTLVLSISRLWAPEVAGGVGGTILAVASLADIGFNLGFGHLVNAIGYRNGFLIMPVCMILCCALIFSLGTAPKREK